MGCLGTASVSDLPLILKFVLQQVTSKNAVEVRDAVSQLPGPAGSASSDHRGSQGKAGFRIFLSLSPGCLLHPSLLTETLHQVSGGGTQEAASFTLPLLSQALRRSLGSVCGV